MAHLLTLVAIFFNNRLLGVIFSKNKRTRVLHIKINFKSLDSEPMVGSRFVSPDSRPRQRWILVGRANLNRYRIQINTECNCHWKWVSFVTQKRHCYRGFSACNVPHIIYCSESPHCDDCKIRYTLSLTLAFNCSLYTMKYTMLVDSMVELTVHGRRLSRSHHACRQHENPPSISS